jgi:hypothetical protein
MEGLRREVDARRLTLGSTGVSLGWRDIVTIADASGLTGALRDMARRGSAYRSDPVVTVLAGGIRTLDPHQRQQLARRFLQRIESDPLLTEIGGVPGALSVEDMERLTVLVSLSLAQAMRELGLSDEQIARLAVITDDLARPLTDLTEVYVQPRTVGQKLRRLWRLQLLGLRALQILARSRRFPTATLGGNGTERAAL